MAYIRSDPEKFREDLMNIARTTLSSKILTQHKEHFAELAVKSVLRLKVRFNSMLFLFIAVNYKTNYFTWIKIICSLQGSGSLDAIQIIKKLGGSLSDSYLDEGCHQQLFLSIFYQLLYGACVCCTCSNAVFQCHSNYIV